MCETKTNKKLRKNGKTHEQFVQEVTNKFGDVYNFLTEYTKYENYILVEHKCEDGDWYRWNVLPQNILYGKGLCPKCSKKDTGQEAYERKVRKLVGDEYKVIGEFKGFNERILMRHEKEECLHEFLISPNEFLHTDTRCPNCTPKSKGENIIDLFLKGNFINYGTQYRFKDCKYKTSLRFDFAVFEDKEKIKLTMLIEYQGQHHYQPCTYNGISKEKAEDKFREQQTKDNIKRDYCKTNNIKLLEIPYWEKDNIESILSKELNIDLQEVS